jgi:membrane protein YqaA with SNARE-associated domain
VGVRLWLAPGLWGFAEATVFFIVPDVLLTWIAVRYGIRQAVMASFAAGAGAVLGGVVMYMWAVHDPALAREVTRAVPAISASMVAEVGAEVRNSGVKAIFAGGFTGVPYKIYAVESGAAGIGMAGFVLVTLMARLARFLGSVFLAAGLAWLLARRLAPETVNRTLIVCWIGFYAGYFALLAA